MLAALNVPVEPESQGDLRASLRWTCQSTRRFVADLLRLAGYSTQANRKTTEGRQHPDRNAQFEYIARRVGSAQLRGQPEISVDTPTSRTTPVRPFNSRRRV